MPRASFHLLAALTLLGTPAPCPAQRTTEVIVIGANHSIYLTRFYTPTELRALLRKIAPDAVGIENFADWQEAGVQFHPGMPEPAVAMSWADRNRVPVYGVKEGDDVPGWQDQARGIQQYRDSMSALARSDMYQRQLRGLISVQARMSFEDTLEGVIWTHSPAGIEARERGRRSFTEEVQRTLRAVDDTIALGIVTLVRRIRPRRLAIILGSDHYGPTRRLLAAYPDIRVLPTERFLPLTQEDLNAAWDPFDAEMVLGSHLADFAGRAVPVSRDHARTRKELDRLIAYAPDSAPTLFFLARWHMLFQRWNQADALLNRVRGGAPGADVRLPVAYRYRSPPLPTYRSLATFELASLNDLRGNREAARLLFMELRSLPPADLLPRIDVTMTFDMSAYLDSLIKSPFVGGPPEYGRMMDARRPLFWATAPEQIRALAARRTAPRSPPNDR